MCEVSLELCLHACVWMGCRLSSLYDASVVAKEFYNTSSAAEVSNATGEPYGFFHESLPGARIVFVKLSNGLSTREARACGRRRELCMHGVGHVRCGACYRLARAHTRLSPINPLSLRYGTHHAYPPRGLDCCDASGRRPPGAARLPPAASACWAVCLGSHNKLLCFFYFGSVCIKVLPFASK